MSHHLQRELLMLEKSILRECADVEKSLSMATRAVIDRDAELAKQVIDSDVEIDNMEVATEEECLKILALYQPVAVDLRFIVAMLKINNDLERIGDLAVNIAERALYLAGKPNYPSQFDFESMARIVSEMLKNSVDSLVEMNTEQASGVCEQDDVVDQMNKAMYKLVKDLIEDGHEDANMLIHLLSISRHLERIADHATNIAEDVIYMIKGNIVRHRIEDYTTE